MWKIQSRPHPLGRSVLGALLLLAAELYIVITNFRETEKIRRYVDVEPPLHLRRTLAQYSHYGKHDTMQYDKRQILLLQNYPKSDPDSLYKDYKATANSADELFTTSKPRAETPHVYEGVHWLRWSGHYDKLLMVDQLWLWILDDSRLIFYNGYQVQNTDYLFSYLDTVITSFSGKINSIYGRSSVHKDIRRQLQRLFQGGNEIPFNVYDLVNIILEHCCGTLFDNFHPKDDSPNIPVLYSRAISILVS